MKLLPIDSVKRSFCCPAQKSKGIDKIVSLMNQLKSDVSSNIYKDFPELKRFFISRARDDQNIANAVADYLKNKGLTVLIGDNSIRDDKMILSTIEELLTTSEVCLVLWSKKYAVSPWCYDELMLAISRKSVGHIKIIIFNLDNSPVVPKEARSLPIFHVSSADEINTMLAVQLTQKSEPNNRL